DQPEHGAEGLPRARPRGARRGASRAGHLRLALARARHAGRACVAPLGSPALAGASQGRRVGRGRRHGTLRRRPAHRVRGGRGMTVIPAVQTQGLGKRYGSKWALRDCSLTIPPGSVTALVGPNGAGKTTLLHLVIGLARPSVGEVRVLGWSPRQYPQVVLPRVGFVAQEHPLYRGFRLAEMLKLGRKLNPHWDDE